MARQETDDAPRIPRPYDTGTQTLIYERGRISIGQVIALDETSREPLYGIRFTESRRLMFRAHEITAYSASRSETLDGVLRAIFAAFRAEDEA